MNNLERIKSFSVNHDILIEGIYTSKVDKDITTYDIRMLKPNNDIFLDTGSIHTMEHLFATYIRNTNHKDSIIYVGPMGCRTGFYLLVRNLSPADTIKLVIDSFTFIKDFIGDIPGTDKIECGNYKDHNLEKAKIDAKDYLTHIMDWTVEKLNYDFSI